MFASRFAHPCARSSAAVGLTIAALVIQGLVPGSVAARSQDPPGDSGQSVVTDTERYVPSLPSDDADLPMGSGQHNSPPVMIGDDSDSSSGQIDDDLAMAPSPKANLVATGVLQADAPWAPGTTVTKTDSDGTAYYEVTDGGDLGKYEGRGYGPIHASIALGNFTSETDLSPFAVIIRIRAFDVDENNPCPLPVSAPSASPGPPPGTQPTPPCADCARIDSCCSS